MPSLLELQARVMSGILDGVFDDVCDLIEATDVEPQHRLRIYRNTMLENFTSSLRSSYPVVARLGGEEYFGAVVRLYQSAHPSRSGDLLHVGAGFPAFLATHHAGDGFDYFAEVARLEWSCHEALCSENPSSLDLHLLSAVAAENYDTLGFVVHPSLRLFRSRYPCLSIWQTHSNFELEPQPIDLKGDADVLALCMSTGQLMFFRLSEAEHSFLTECSLGFPLCRAVEAAFAIDAAFDPTKTLQRCAQGRLFSGFS